MALNLKKGNLYFIGGRFLRFVNHGMSDKAWVYTDESVFLKENAFSHILVYLLCRYERFLSRFMRFEHKYLSASFVQGERLPKTSITYWLASVYVLAERLINRFGHKESQIGLLNESRSIQ